MKSPELLPTQWVLDLPRIEGQLPGLLYLILAPTRTRFDSIALLSTNQVFSPQGEGVGHVWTIHEPGGLENNDKIKITGFGDPPALLKAGLLTKDIKASSSYLKEVLSSRDNVYTDVFNARALALETLEYAHHAFAAFDAWSDYFLLEWITTPEKLTNLSLQARKVFVPPAALFYGISHPPLCIAQLITMLHYLLIGVPQERAKAHNNQKNPLFDLEVTDTTDLAWFERNHLTLEELIALVAKFHHRVLRAAFLRNGFGVTDMESAIARFSVGHLRLQPSNGNVSDAWLNFEPDGAQFFLFGEFYCLAHKHAASDMQPFWYSMASLFVALQPHYCKTYYVDGKPRKYSSYVRRSTIQPGPQPDQLLNDIAIFRRKYPTINDVHLRSVINAADAFADELQ